MKTKTCAQLSGTCDMRFLANTFHEIAQLSQTHGNETFKIGDQNRLKVINEMSRLIQKPKVVKL